MENKLNKFAIEDYAKKLSEKLTKEFFGEDKFFITGEEIISFSPVEQINLFIIKNIFFQWKDETEKVKKSSFFNYEDAEVSEALTHLANALSKHIKLSRDLFEQQLSLSIEETLTLALSPYHYFKQYYFVPERTKIYMTDLREMSRYLRINRLLFDHFIKKVETYRIPSFLVTDILDYFQQAYYDSYDQFDSYDSLIASLDKLLELDLSKLVTDLKRKDIPAPTPLEIFESQKMAGLLTTEPSSITLPTPVLTKPEKISLSDIEMKEDPIKDEIAVDTSAKTVKIHLSVNQRILYTRELFNGNIVLLNDTIHKIEQTSDAQKALAITAPFKWSPENEAAQEFYDMLEAKFR